MKLSRSLLITTYRLCTVPLRKWDIYRRQQTNECPIGILFYHRVSDHSPTPWTIGRQQFLKQIRWLSRNFDLISIQEAQRRIRTGNCRPSVCITFDDGYEENAEFALPLLASLNIPTMYYVSQDFLDSDQPFPHDAALGLQLLPNRSSTLKRWRGSCIEFGSHSRSHSDLGSITDIPRLYDEIIVAGQNLSQQLDAEIEHFAFPFGQIENVNEIGVEIARQSSLKSISFALGGWNRVGGSPWQLQRMHGDPSLTRLKNWLSGDPRMLRRPVPHFESSIEIQSQVRQFLKSKVKVQGASTPQTLSPLGFPTLEPSPSSLDTSGTS